MARPAPANETKYWYKISVDSLRAWIVGLVLVVVGLGGYFGYGVLRLDTALEEARALSAALADDRQIGAFRSEYQTAVSSLEEAERLRRQRKHKEALTEAERSKSVLLSIRDSIRHRTPQGQAQFISVQGGVQFRRGQVGDWQAAHSRTVLQGGDYVRTTGSGSAEVMTAAGALITIRPETVIVVPGRGEGGEGRRGISLEAGWVNLSTTQRASTVTTPDAEARVMRQSKAEISYDEDRKQGRFAAHRGGIEVTSGGVKRRIGQFERVDQRSGRLSEVRPVPLAPSPLEPADNFEISLSDTDRIVLRWQRVSGAASYSLQVSHNRLFVDNLIDVERRSRSATIGLRAEGSFVWRVATQAADGSRSPWSSPQRFRVTGGSAQSVGAASPGS